MVTTGFTSDEARKAATDIFYFQELDRQAELAVTSIYFAVMRGRETGDPRNTKVWGALQNALFASICIARLLKAGNVKDDYPGMSQNQTKKFAKRRGDRLREVLGIEDDSFIFEVEKVRNAFEHYDEHLDSRLVGGAECFSDWYITDQIVLRTPGGDAPTAVGLRVFFAPGGILYFENEELHLFELEVELIQLRRKVPSRFARPRPGSRAGARSGHISGSP